MRPFQKADSAQKCAELVMSDAKCGDAFSSHRGEVLRLPPDGSHCTRQIVIGGYGVYEFQTCGEACFVDVSARARRRRGTPSRPRR